MSNPFTDDEYLDYIYSVSVDNSYVSEYIRAYNENFDLEKEFAVLVAAGVYQPDEIEKFKEISLETYSLDKAFRGEFINSLKQMALMVVEDDREYLTSIPVGLLPSRELNACAIRTPSNGAVIILNQGVIGQLMYVCRCTLSFISWQSNTPFCRDASQGDYAKALIGLAKYVMTGDSKYIVRFKDVLQFPSLSDYEETTILFCQLMELFILLHEYGHVVKGHLNSASIRTAFDGELPELQEYSKSEQQEFEADQYAINQLIQKGVEGGLRQSDIALCAGLVMKFFELCEAVSPSDHTSGTRTHPPARDRWEKIKTHTSLESANGALALNLDPAFKVILDGMQHEEWAN
jgi:hypothetical protein